jgi:hypothetical protein
LSSTDPQKRRELLEKLKQFFEEWPLYRKLRYQGFGLCHEMMPETVSSFVNTQALEIPGSLQLYCGHAECKKVQRWDVSNYTMRQTGRALLNRKLDGALQDLTYTCRNCGVTAVTYFVGIEADHEKVEIIKVGQWPAQSREPDPVLVQSWTPEDLDLYRKALTLRNSGWGLGALPYLRRVIENRMHDLLDLIGESIRANDPPDAEALQSTLSGVRNGLRFVDKLDFARDHLPDGLTPKGAPNPVGTLYILISDGIHVRTDAECIEIFDDCKAAFEFVIKKLSEAKRDKFEDTKPYVLTELGKQFVHYTMNEVVTRIEAPR